MQSHYALSCVRRCNKHREEAASIQPASTYDWSICQETFLACIQPKASNLFATQDLGPVLSSIGTGIDRALGGTELQGELWKFNFVLACSDLGHLSVIDSVQCSIQCTIQVKLQLSRRAEAFHEQLL